jgi:hypothetical protein
MCDNSAPITTWAPFPERIWIPPADGRLTPRPKWVPKAPQDDSYWRPTFCIVARTYYAHGPGQTMFGLDKFLTSILSQTYKNWYLILLDTDPSHEFEYLYSYLKDWALDHEPLRVKIMASNLESLSLYTSWHHDNFSRLHQQIYWNTDEALLTSCPSSSRYFIATNADNWYHEKFLETVYNTVGRRESHMVGVDFSSRHAAWMWGVANEKQTCKVYDKFSPIICNAFVPGKTDLGSLVFNASRFRDQEISFSKIISECTLPPSDGDGCMVRHLRTKYQWKAERIAKNLFAHAPNPWMCFLYGGIIVREPEEDPEIPPNFSCQPPAQAHVPGATSITVHTYPQDHLCIQSAELEDDPELFDDLPYIFNASGRFPVRASPSKRPN